MKVSIHAPTRGATTTVCRSSPVPWFQSTLPHGERHTCRPFLFFNLNVSIHAPTRGATRRRRLSAPLTARVSIHAPTRGATSSLRTASPSAVFQSTLPHGERRRGRPLFLRPRVSIHAPTRGATVCHFGKSLLTNVSIHAPTRGATSYPCKADGRGRFQSTLPHGERLMSESLLSQPLSFNPRSHTGSDAYFAAETGNTLVSIHAPTRGATFSSLAPWCSSSCFNPRSHTGSDNGFAIVITDRVVSIHAPTRGATRQSMRSSRSVMFQSTLPHGERPRRAR